MRARTIRSRSRIRGAVVNRHKKLLGGGVIKDALPGITKLRTRAAAATSVECGCGFQPLDGLKRLLRLDPSLLRKEALGGSAGASVLVANPLMLGGIPKVDVRVMLGSGDGEHVRGGGPRLLRVVLSLLNRDPFPVHGLSKTNGSVPGATVPFRPTLAVPESRGRTRHAKITLNGSPSFLSEQAYLRGVLGFKTQRTGEV